MTYLLDTHAAIWLFEGNQALGQKTRETIIREADITLVSYVSVWETAIKKRKGRLQLKHDLDYYVLKAGFKLLNIELVHIHTIVNLPLIHQDPFDRLLIAQALSEKMTFITGDDKILRYPGVSLMDAKK